MSRPAAVLFDLGNVLIDVDIRRVFDFWAGAASADAATLANRWQADAAYEAHEVGDLDFEGYAAHLAGTLALDLGLEEWRQGWNAIFRDSFPEVIRRLPALSTRYPCYCFTNTNPTHQNEWQRLFAAELASLERVYVSSEIGRRKPDVNAFDWVAQDMGLPPATIHFIDDSRENVEGARAAGMRATLAGSPDQVVAVIDALLDL